MTDWAAMAKAATANVVARALAALIAAATGLATGCDCDDGDDGLYYAYWVSSRWEHEDADHDTSRLPRVETCWSVDASEFHRCGASSCARDECGRFVVVAHLNGHRLQESFVVEEGECGPRLVNVLFTIPNEPGTDPGWERCSDLD